MSHPYSGLPAQNFWSRAVAGVPPFMLNPASEPPFKILPATRVATAGSCFAQHIARELRHAGYNYYVTEAGAELGAEEAQRRNYGLFSARYGNVYTTRQLLQLLRRAFGQADYALPDWQNALSWIDPFRPNVEPGGFVSRQALEDDVTRHLASVRRMAETMEVFVFTLGLTEGWIHRASGAVLPLAPGVSGGEWDPAVYEFRNFRVGEVMADLNEAIALLRHVNPGVRLILTVSPVPLAATYEKRHVLVSTVHSKSILRVAAAEAEQAFADVAYFPSYELITLPVLGARYFADDLRSVQDHGVKHVMRAFFSRFTVSTDSGPEPVRREYDAGLRQVQSVICDEDLIERAG
jgi:hypothetical protein